ncbi:MAG: RpiB/LacA/LacB family sugar-phosphate isomerase [bacterium]|nr:RpiB/LacA/LacB family sugar-phosphate isomerase [bacterium]
MKIFISSDHAGFELKAHLVSFLQMSGDDVVDLGPTQLNVTDDYPDTIAPVAKEISAGRADEMGIVIGHSGQGEALVANKFKNVRAGIYYGGPIEILKLLREHNNANVLSLGAHFLSKEEAEVAVQTFLQTAFSGDERHVRRIEKVHDLE